MTKKIYSDEQSDANQLSIMFMIGTPYTSVQEEFNEALKDITFAGMADECFGPFFAWWLV